MNKKRIIFYEDISICRCCKILFCKRCGSQDMKIDSLKKIIKCLKCGAKYNIPDNIFNTLKVV